MLIIGGSRSGKANSLFNPKNHQPDFDIIYLYAQDPYEAKKYLLINQHKCTGLKPFNDSKDFIEYSNEVGDIYKNIEEYNSNNQRK